MSAGVDPPELDDASAERGAGDARLALTCLATAAVSATASTIAAKRPAPMAVELRELAHGIHPSVLTEFGLGAALRALVGRTPVVGDLDFAIQGRLPDALEVATYYLCAESLTNVAKYAPGRLLRDLRTEERRLLARPHH